MAESSHPPPWQNLTRHRGRFSSATVADSPAESSSPATVAEGRLAGVSSMCTARGYNISQESSGEVSLERKTVQSGGEQGPIEAPATLWNDTPEYSYLVTNLKAKNFKLEDAQDG